MSSLLWDQDMSAHMISALTMSPYQSILHAVCYPAILERVSLPTSSLSCFPINVVHLFCLSHLYACHPLPSISISCISQWSLSLMHWGTGGRGSAGTAPAESWQAVIQHQPAVSFFGVRGGEEWAERGGSGLGGSEASFPKS